MLNTGVMRDPEIACKATLERQEYYHALQSWQWVLRFLR